MLIRPMFADALERRYLIVLAAVYVILYGTFIALSQGLPYVLDNNESFSSLWHATNLHRFDIALTYGVTDESYGVDAAAHPYVYTHQGNFPRLFAYFIYLFGARTVEAQILVTTFTVGLAAITLAYMFFARLVSPLFGFIAALILVTDYVLVGQWQVVTYRVWHEFFVFSSALCTHLSARQGRLWRGLTALNFACLFYFELVFATFVFTFSAIYSLFLLGRSKDAVRFMAYSAVGVCLGLGIFILQLVLLLGWRDFLQDLYLTFIARNEYLSDPDLLQQIKQFFDSKKIVFWYNLVEGSKLRGLRQFIASFTYFELQIHTPWLTAVSGLVLLGFGIGVRQWKWRPAADIHYFVIATFIVLIHLAHKLWRGQFNVIPSGIAIALVVLWVAWCFRSYPRLAASSSPTSGPALPGSDAMQTTDGRKLGVTALALLLPSLAEHLSSNPWIFSRYSAYFIAYLVACVAVAAWTSYDLILEGYTDSRGRPQWLDTIGHLSSAFVFCVAIGVLLAVMLMGEWAFGTAEQTHKLTADGVALAVALATTLMVINVAWFRVGLQHMSRFIPPAKVAMAAGFLVAVAALLYASPKFYHGKHSVIWTHLVDVFMPGPLKYIGLCLAVAVALVLAFSDAKSLLRNDELKRLRLLILFVAAGFGAYAIVFILSPGYVFTGYRFRLVPISIFHTNALLALSVFVMVLAATRGRGSSGNELDSSSLRTLGALKRASLLQIASFALLLMIVWFWIAMQVRYVQLLPPDSYSFLSLLREPPYRGRSFIVNTYAAPIAASTGEWAYMHGGLVAGVLPVEKDKHIVAFDDTYLWLADKHENKAYRRPQLFICITPPAIPLVADRLWKEYGRGSGPHGCEEHILVRLAAPDMQGKVYPPLKLDAWDEEGPGRVGYRRWAIVELLWPKDQ